MIWDKILKYYNNLHLSLIIMQLIEKRDEREKIEKPILIYLKL